MFTSSWLQSDPLYGSSTTETTLIDATDGSTPDFEAVIIIIGESGAGKSTLINLIAGKPIITHKCVNIQGYICTYQDKDAYTWNLHLIDIPGHIYNKGKSLDAIMQYFNTMDSQKFSNSISSIIYCQDINKDQLAGLGVSTLMHIFDCMPGHQWMKNAIFCTTQWDILVDKSVGEHRLQELKKDHRNEALDLGARITRHDNTRTSVEDMLGLIIGKEAVKLILLKELGCPEMTAAGEATFKQKYEETKQLLQDIRSTQIKEAARRAEINKEGEELRWQQNLAHMSAKLDRVKMTQEKEVIQRRIEREMEVQGWKRKMWDAIQKTREERMGKDDAEHCRRLAEAIGLKCITDPACSTYHKVGDAPVSGMKVLEVAFPGDWMGIEKQKQDCSHEGSKVAVGLSDTHNHRVDDHIVNDENSTDFVPLQFKPFTGKYAITPELASKKFESDDVDLLLIALNFIFDTNVPISYPGIPKTLEHLIKIGYDLGAVYAHMRVIWSTTSVPSTLLKVFTDNNPDYDIGSPELASRKCQSVDELLSFLNMSFNTEIPHSKPGVKKVLKFLVDQGYEFGDICAHMRNTWPRTPEVEWSRRQAGVKFSPQITLSDWHGLKGKSNRIYPGVWEDFRTFEKQGEKYEDQRWKSLCNNTIQEPDLIKPRRIWDLYAHRIIPFQFSLVDAGSHNHSIDDLHLRSAGFTRYRRYHPVSHSWTEDMSPVDSPVNAFEWPVPLPRGVTLEAVRNELLNLGAQYVWLDVVCLRQKSLNSTSESL